MKGFIIDMTSLKYMFTEYVEEKKLIDGIPTYMINQDPIELMFGRIRQCGGYNNNPNVLQFKGAFRRIQCSLKMDTSQGSNCRMFQSPLPDNLFFSNIYFVSSKRPRIFMDQQVYDNQKDSILELVDEHKELEQQSIVESDKPDDVHMLPYLLDSTSQFMIIYLASKIEKKIVECKSFHCNSCRLVFSQNDKDSSMDSKFACWSSCVSTVYICKMAEKFFKLYDGDQSKPTYDFKVLYCLIFRSLNLDLVYPNSEFHCDKSHKYQFIKCVIGQYVSMRAAQIAKQITLERQDKLIRQQYNQLTNAKGQ